MILVYPLGLNPVLPVERLLGVPQCSLNLVRAPEFPGDLAHPFGDLLDRLGREVPALDRLHLALEPPEIEEELLLRCRGAELHQRP